MFILGFKLSNNSNTQWSTILHSRELELPDSLGENYQSIYQYSFYVQYISGKLSINLPALILCTIFKFNI